MTQTVGGDIDVLRAAVAGPVIGPDDGEYDQARSLWNGDVDRRPAAIARCTGPADVAAALSFAQGAGAGGHGARRRAQHRGLGSR
jgi:hypothetical protein